MKVTETNLKGCFIIDPTIYEDDRGVFFETYQKERLDTIVGYEVNFVQANQSLSQEGTLRGLHFQRGNYAQAKLVSVVKGNILDVVVDIRKDSNTYGEHFKIQLSEINKKQLFIPKGMAHGFLALEETIFTYQCDNFYNRNSEQGIIYNDEKLGINWGYPESKMIISLKDRELPSFSEIKL
ncbi:dTDP-4-dehydrorhamnose 3,5-epimerase [Maribacter vaceletii]|uniref:dTDP-4-dehydrorhamnose 3,5-epimerase n=1 Tax=Maribacter vaceletii TaxID=1206816 RepID=A0A495EDR9_9FLAO|nr:dTDP-4-dehydrorhamnose 3,5-epimerase [Maribacter vaceletii]RKR14779.1 dTDP-4-dehydrorhamnose 3,5-epimerase [Maribacter vaceletii]